MFRLPDDFAAVGIARQSEEIFRRQLISVNVNFMLPSKLPPPLLAASSEPMMLREEIRRRAFDSGLELFAESCNTLFRGHIIKELF